MRFELFNRSKFRDGSAPGDDVSLVIPGVVYGVFDGATDARGTVVDGIAAGRLAALTVASDTASLALAGELSTLSAEAIIDRLSRAMKRRTAPIPDLSIPPSTTIALAVDQQDEWRFLLLGDTGLRLNRQEVHQSGKRIDAVSTAARVAVFHELTPRLEDMDEVERATRRCILLGFENAIAEGLLSERQAQEIITGTAEATGLGDEPDLVSAFLMGGIRIQFRYGNTTGTPLSFDTLNGTTPQLRQWTDFVRPKSAVRSIEIFSDGYPSLPDEPTVSAWEDAFAAVEAADPYKIGEYASVKGSTRTEFFDDRTILILEEGAERSGMV